MLNALLVLTHLKLTSWVGNIMIPIYSLGNQSTERLNNLLKVIAEPGFEPRKLAPEAVLPSL